MNKALNYSGWFLFAFFSLLIGCYPVFYFLADMANNGLLSQKEAEILTSGVWNWMFYQHIIFGGICLFIGWIQFNKAFRNSYLNIHRLIGKVYVVTALLSGIAGLYIAIFAEGGWVAQLGFGAMAVSWLVTTFLAYTTIRRKEVGAHKNWMLRSYALCWAAVTLRIELPLFQIGFGMDFISAYLIIAWLCWVPNLLVAEIIIRNQKGTPTI